MTDNMHVADADNWPRWRLLPDNVQLPEEILVEPAFKEELGTVFIKIGDKAVWLTSAQWEDMKKAGDAAINYDPYADLAFPFEEQGDEPEWQTS